MGAVAGIVVGVLVFVTLVIVGLVSAIILTWYCKCRQAGHFTKMEQRKGIENPNYGDVDPSPLISGSTQNQTIPRTPPAVPSDYEVPVSMNSSEQSQQQEHHAAEQPVGEPTHQFTDIPDRNLTSSHVLHTAGIPPTQDYINIPAGRHPTSSFTRSSDSGDYSYVEVRHMYPQQHQAVRPQRSSHDSNFLQSTQSWADLPTLVAAESGPDPTSGKVASNYTLLTADY